MFSHKKCYLEIAGKGTGWAAADWLKKTEAPPIIVPKATSFDGSKDVMINNIHHHADKRTIRVSAATNVRQWSTTNDRTLRVIPQNGTEEVIGWIKGELVDGNARWWIAKKDGGRIWSGTTS